MIDERLREIRILNHYTVEDVAYQIGVTKQAVSKYETGNAIPSDDVLKKIIEMFKLPAGYFMKSNNLPEETSPLFYRRNKRTSQRELEEARICLKWCHELVVAAKGIIDMPALNLPSFEEEISIEEKAKKLRIYWGISNEPISDLPSLLQTQGIFLFSKKFQNEKIDGCSQVIGEYPIIVLNRNKGSDERKNFSIAHELGHIILHCCKEIKDYEQIESEADQFAASFLLPMEELEKEVTHINAESLQNIGDKWHVSPQAVLERCRRLGFLGIDEERSETKRTYLLQRLNSSRKKYIPSNNNFCNISEVMRLIDTDTITRDKFLKRVRFPVLMIRDLCQITTLFEGYDIISDDTNEIDGVQMTLAFQNER